MKEYTITIDRGSRGTRKVTGSIEYLNKYFGYTLLKGQSWEHERGNKRINLNPTTIKSLVTNLNNAESNAAANGWASTCYYLE